MPKDTPQQRWKNKKQAEARQSGICTRCYKNPVSSGKKSCEECRENARIAYHRRKIHIWYKQSPQKVVTDKNKQM